MKYFIDFEFIEGFYKPLFGKRRHFIDMISIGIVAEDGREYYAISNQYDYKDANNWVKENVIAPMYIQSVHGDMRNHMSTQNFNKYVGKHPATIGLDVREFCGGSAVEEFAAKGIEFYGYYSDYDWVVFCSMFGRMIDLPKGFPMYCKDLKQMLDEKLDKSIFEDYGEPIKGAGAYENLEGKLKLTKARIDYPKETNEHNAIADAKWNKALFDFIKTI